jgi:WASH complex subunit CCDC53
MTDTGLPSLEPALSHIPPIPIKKTLMLINNFVVNTVDYLNKFVVICERKLSTTSNQIQRVEVVLKLLEAKLSSIDWLESGAPPVGVDPNATIAANGTTTTTTTGAAAAVQSTIAAPAATGGGGGDTAAAAAVTTVAVVEEEAPAATAPPLRDDPRFSQYFKMLRLGVLKPVLKGKMSAEGVDPDIIDMNPDAPTPAHLGAPASGGGGGASLISPGRSGIPGDESDASSVESDLDAD